MRHMLQILLEELEIELIKNIPFDLPGHTRECLIRGIHLDIERFCNERRVPEYKKERAFVKHIENHFKDMPEPFLRVVCKICNKDIDQILEETDELDLI